MFIDKYLAVYDGHLLKLYEFGQQDCHLHQSRTLTTEGETSEISSLHVYNIEDPETHETSFLLVGVSATSKTILNWHLVPDNSQLDIAFLGSKEMTWQSEPTIIVSASQWTTNTASKLLYRLAMHKRTTFVILVDNVLFFYSISIANEEVEWDTLYTLDISYLESPIQSIKFAPGVMAIVCGEEANILSIWTEMRSGSPPECSQLMTFDQSIQDLVWNVTSDAQYILAIALPKRIEIFGQKRASGLDAVEESWTCYTKFEVNTPKNVTALAWVDCGVLIAAAGNQLLSYLKWLTEDDTVNASIQSYKTSKLEPMTSIFDISYEMNGPLPFYHPYHLVHYTMWGKMDLVHNVLLSLYNFLKQFVDDEDNTISEFPTISLPTILKLQNVSINKKTRQKGGYGGLFDDSSDESNDEDDDPTRHLTLNEAKNLAYSLKSKSLPGINENEKMHLIAMVNTIVEITDQGESLDENGARFIALLENHFHLKQALAENGEQIDLAPKDYVWALHSQSQDLLLERCVRLCKDRFVWKDARSLGMFMWLQKIDVVREQMSQIARNTYLSKQDDRDPIDCTLFYFALRKKNLVQGLWNTTSHHKEQGIMKKFLANDFNDPRWQRAASKNAYALLGKQRFEYAAAFFLLADKLKDAVNVILKNVKDYQLAIAICRVYEGDHSLLLKEVLENTVIPVAIETNDCWLASIAFWLLNKQKEAVRSIVVPLSQFSDRHIDTSETDSAATVQNPNSFILYNHLKASLQQANVVSYNVEYMFYLQVAQSYERLGCPLLALYVLTEYYMPPPPTFQSISYEEEAKDEKESKPTLDRAEDLFTSSPPQKPSFASDIFADESDSLFKTDKPSYASNLFDESEDDIFASSNKQPSDNLFDDVEEDMYSDKNSQKIEKNREYDGLDVYKAMLVIRMLQTFFHAATALYNGLGEISDVHEATYRDNFISNRNTLLDLGASLKIPADILSRLLMEKSIETDVFPLYLHILNEQVPENFDVHQFLRAFKVGCFEKKIYIIKLLHVVKTFPIWSDLRSRYCNPKTASLMTHQIILTTYIGAILITLRERYYEKAWTFLCHFKFFLEALGSNDSLTAIKNCLDLLLKDEVRMAEIAPDEFEDFSDESMFGYDMHEEIYRPLIDSQDRAAGSNMLEIASLNFVLSSLEHSMQCQGRHNSLSGKFCITL
ncbi:RAVE protein 1 C terminal-domain-containing protein [Choanephora cucurbitarum]|nr:RAVE protein 1 C terminal-domain-containing protein [Choanephora cucurbitarum]